MNDTARDPQALQQSPNDPLRDPPTSVPGILSKLGPGLIIAASIVGSGELIATTKTGAEAGFTLLWLVILGCVIKVFAQIEIGRYTLSEGRTAIDGFDQVPGPRFRVGWLVWYWLFMFLCSTSQLGGIVGVVGQTLSIPLPITGDFNRLLDLQESYDELAAERTQALRSAHPQETPTQIKTAVQSRIGPRPDQRSHFTYDDVIWSAIVTVVTASLLVIGRYALVQNVSTFLVAGFTAVMIFNVFALQTHDAWSIHAQDLLNGLSFQLPSELAGATPLATALATFGIIGVGAAELVAYPYWCLEKGYARATGPRDDSAAWAARARGWLRVLRWDAWCSMVIYTFATLAFYLTGAAVLHRAGRSPSDDQLMHTLVEMFQPVFGPWAAWIFLFGAFAVLYSTFFVATAGNARIAADAVRVFRLGAKNDASLRFWVRLWCGLLPFISLGVFVWQKNPVTLVLISGLAQAVMLPMLGGAALYFRYHRCDPRLRPGKLWDALLWLSFAALIVTGAWGLATNAAKVSALLISRQ